MSEGVMDNIILVAIAVILKWPRGVDYNIRGRFYLRFLQAALALSKFRPARVIVSSASSEIKSVMP